MNDSSYISEDRPWRKENVFPTMAYKPTIEAFGIYGILNRDNSKIYIGSTVNFLNRWRAHSHRLTKQKHDNRFLQRAFLKNPEAFEFVVIEELKDTSKLLIREQFWMGFYRATNDNLGYNLRPKSSSNLGLKWGTESRAKLSRSRTGKPGNRKGIKKTPEEIEKHKASLKAYYENGGKHPMLGKKQKPESMARRTLLRRTKGTYGRPIIQMDMEGNEISRFRSMIAAQTHFNKPTSGHIGACARGKKARAYGFKWKYA